MSPLSPHFDFIWSDFSATQIVERERERGGGGERERERVVEEYVMVTVAVEMHKTTKTRGHACRER